MSDMPTTLDGIRQWIVEQQTALVAAEKYEVDNPHSGQDAFDPLGKYSLPIALTILADALAILTTGAAPRCPMCEAEVWKPFPLHDGDTGVVLDPLLTVHCNGTVCDWQGDLQEALAHGNHVALRAREATK